MDPAEFTVGWICALPLELTAAQGMLEEEYEDSDLEQNPRDTNKYILGQITGHKVVLTCLISAGTNHAGSAALHMRYTFKRLKCILMVGIGGGIPNLSTGKDVRLGDVVVSMPSGRHSGVIQFDSGKLLQDKDFLITGALKAPPPFLQSVVKFLMARHEIQENYIARYIQEMLQKHPKNTRTGTDYRRPDRGTDLLFRAEYVCRRDGNTCEECDRKQLITRPDRDDEPVIHYGNIASGNSVVRDALKRDNLGKDCGALCVEMEAAGLMDEDCLVIRGICDYADSHKNKHWQRYAATAAAAYAKELLGAVRLTSRASSSAPAAQFAEPSQSSSTVPTRTSRSEGAWYCREGEDILMEDQVERCSSCSSGSQDADNMGQCDFRIFELRKDGCSLPTRRIAIRSCENGGQCMSFWMPPDNVRVQVGIEHRQVTISWSDCSHIHETEKGYRTTFTCRYVPAEPNRGLEFESKNISVIQGVAELLLYPTLGYWHYEQIPVVSGSSVINTLRVYKHADEHTDFAILVSSNLTNATRCSKIYMSRPCLDFRLDRVHGLLIFKEMRYLDYSSSLVKSSENDILRHLNPEGGPDGWDWKTEDLELSPDDHKGLTMANLMTALTGWKLLFKEVVSSVVLKGRVRSSNIKGALVTVWERTNESGRDAHLLVRASDDRKESESTTWLSMSLTSRPVELTMPDVKTIVMDVQAFSRGPKVSIHQMTVDPRPATKLKQQKIHLHFESKYHRENFYDVYRTMDQPLRQGTTIGGRASAPWLEKLSSVSSWPTSNDS